jgi:hypothetical protein
MAGDDLEPWQQPGAVPRDVEPHRGPRLLLLANAALLSGLLAVCLPGALVPAFVLGVSGYWLAGKDLEKMRAGFLDPSGRTTACRARQRSLWGLFLGLAAESLWMVIVCYYLQKR